MLKVVDDLACQLFHGPWAEVVSYSRQGAWRCNKPGCSSQARQDRAIGLQRQQRQALRTIQVNPAARAARNQHAA